MTRAQGAMLRTMAEGKAFTRCREVTQHDLVASRLAGKGLIEWSAASLVLTKIGRIIGEDWRGNKNVRGQFTRGNPGVYHIIVVKE